MSVGAKNLSPLGEMQGIMCYNPEQDHRRSIRLKGFDCTQQGAYFVTVCTQGKLCLFGAIVEAKVILNDTGRIVEKCWRDIPAHFPHVELDEFVVMPNHVHGILRIVEPIGAKDFSPLQTQKPSGTSKTIGSVIRGFKIGVTKWTRQHTPGLDVWQRNYYEHVIRNEIALERARQYIMGNPAQWDEDNENPGTGNLQATTGVIAA